MDKNTISIFKSSTKSQIVIEVVAVVKVENESDPHLVEAPEAIAIVGVEVEITID